MLQDASGPCNAPSAYLSLEDTIRRINDGEVGYPGTRHTASTRYTASNSDAAADHDNTIIQCDKAMVFEPGTSEPHLRSIANEPAHAHWTHCTLSVEGACRRTVNVNGDTVAELAIALSNRQFSQLFPDGMCAMGGPPSPSLADKVHREIVKAQASINNNRACSMKTPATTTDTQTPIGYRVLSKPCSLGAQNCITSNINIK
ncbi:hypothetical protein B0H14DRAFT_2768776 [Mycena olivaceomarginata]|nr:hypothetical protein B0H14DRAFT_2768776 [Mycena olivaceomarginata]